MIPSGSTADVPTDGVTLSEKTNTGATVGDFWKCDVRFLGHDLAGNPVATPVVSYAVDFVDK
jgi:hypothetical protein